VAEAAARSLATPMRAAPAAAALLTRGRVTVRAMGASPQGTEVARDKAALRRASRAALQAADDANLARQSECGCWGGEE